LKGERAYAPKQTDFEWVYVFGAVCPATGQSHGCLISFADTSAMNGYLQDFLKHIPDDEHVLMTLDRAGWHRSKALCISENLSLLFLPSYSPELNPVELLWWQMRDKHLSNQVFETTDQLDKGVGDGWIAVTSDPESVRSLCLFPWIKSAINN
jgi:transposase